MFLTRNIQKLVRCQLCKTSLCATSLQPLSTKISNHTSGVFAYNKKDPHCLVKLPIEFSNYRLYSDSSTTPFYVQDEQDFKIRVLDALLPVVVDFYADWCGPCKLLTPRLEREVNHHGGKVLLAKVDVDAMGELAMDLDIMAIPTVMVFKGGKPIDQFQGNIDDDMLKRFIKKAAES